MVRLKIVNCSLSKRDYARLENVRKTRESIYQFVQKAVLYEIRKREEEACILTAKQKQRRNEK